MFKILVSLIFLLIVEINSVKKKAVEKLPYQPEQVHLSFGELANEIVVTWNTWNDSTVSLVEFGLNKLEKSQMGKRPPDKLVDNGDAKSTQYIHRVTLPHLRPNTSYIYRCGSDKGWSQQFHFHVPAIDSKDWVLSMAIYGDFGLKRGHIYPLLLKNTQMQMYDAIIHAGDIAYDMHDQNGETGDAFMRKMESIAAYVPYMTAPGNHEEAYNFSHYRARFSMPGDTEGLFYSFNLGPVHFIAINTEVYYYTNIHYQLNHLIYQYNWLEHDLKDANRPENRVKRPWIITFAHRPMYCSSRNDDDCTPEFVATVRQGIPLMNGYGLEKLLYRYGVDVEIWAHEHSYERMWPVYDDKVFNGSFEEPYRNPGAPVHFITGAAGNKERREKFLEQLPVWSAFQNGDNSFTQMKVYNSTHLHFEQVTYKNKIVDSVWIIKDKHGAYGQ